MTNKILERTMFETSRALEYFTERELSYQTGNNKSRWPLMIVKELMDNALDASENASIAPEIEVGLLHKEPIGTNTGIYRISVSDNGPGIKPETITKILNYLTRTSDKEAYVSPTRGAQGNALKTIFAIPYVLSTVSPPEGTTEIDSQGIHHAIKVKLDAIRQEPRIENLQTEIVKKTGCAISVNLENTGIPDALAKDRFLQILFDYHLFNPHLSLTIDAFSEKISHVATKPDWPKWKPNDFTCPLWYSTGDLKKLILSHVALAQDGGRDLTLREFVAQFRGLTSTAKQKEVTSLLPNIKRLSDFISNGDGDSNLIGQLLLNMQSLSKPVPPEKLGIIGEEHFRRVFGKELKYSHKKGVDNGIPFVVEVAYVPDDTLEQVQFHFGLNFAPASSDPLQEYSLAHENKKQTFEGQGIKGLCAQYKVSSYDKIHVICHMTFPRFRFKDRGKTILEVGNEQFNS
jgi:DNA topoisomerase VI subunit B